MWKPIFRIAFGFGIGVAILTPNLQKVIEKASIELKDDAARITSERINNSR